MKEDLINKISVPQEKINVIANLIDVTESEINLQIEKLLILTSWSKVMEFYLQKDFLKN